MIQFGAYHPWRHFGIGPFVANSALPNSLKERASNTNIPTLFVTSRPQIIADKITPSSSNCGFGLGTKIGSLGKQFSSHQVDAVLFTVSTLMI